MREIKFRGLSIEPLAKEDNWLYGSEIYINYEDKRAYIGSQEVVFETVGQYTGIEDEEGTDICEGDIILHGAYQDDIDLVKYTKGYFYTMNSGYLVSECVNIRVIGNIYEHPHLLGEGA